MILAWGFELAWVFRMDMTAGFMGLGWLRTDGTGKWVLIQMASEVGCGNENL